MSGESLAIPGVLYVGHSSAEEPAVLQVGPATGWVALKGLRTWSREISLAPKADLTDAICSKLGVKLPEKHPEAAKLANARRAAAAAALVALEPQLVDKLADAGVRVHTVGFDRTTAGFYYFAKGGPDEPARVQGNLVEMVAQAAPDADNAALEASLDGLIGRILTELSQGLLNEPQIELAAELPSLGEPDADATAKLQTLEGFLVLAQSRAGKYEERARAALEAVSQATRQGKDVVNVALFGDVRRSAQPELELEYAGGESGALRKLTVPERSRWFITTFVRETVAPPAMAPAADGAKVAAEKAAAEKAAAERAAAEKRAAEERAAAERKAAEERRAAEEKRAAEKKAADEKRAAQEKRAAEEKAAAEKKAAEERAAAEKAAAEKAAAEKAAAEKAAAEKAAEKAAAEKAAAEKAATAEQAAEEEEEREEEREEKEEAPKGKPAPKKPIEPAAKPMPSWVWFLLVLIAAAGAYYFRFMRH